MIDDEVLDVEAIEEIDLEPFKKYIDEDKSKYKRACDCINPKTRKNYIDKDNDFLVGESGGFLLNINFTFVNTHLFREVGRFYEEHGSFTLADEGTIEYRQFIDREEDRRFYGITRPCKKLKDGTIVDLRITGNHYNFVNYGRIKKYDRRKKKSSDDAKKIFGTPEFFDSQYWVFKIKEFCKANGFNYIILKSRRKGMSYIEGVDSANILNLNPDSVIIHAAYDTKYLTKAGAITNMAQRQLNFYELITPFKRGALDKNGNPKGLLKKEITNLIVGYKDANNNDAGYLSTLFTVSTNGNPDAASGKDAVEIKCDELNTFPNFTDFMTMTNPTTTTGAFKTGVISAFGTGGTKEGNWQEFEKHFLDPNNMDFMPFENVWDENSRNEVTGFFLPYWWGLEGTDENDEWSIDIDGNTNYNIALNVSNYERAIKLQRVGLTSDYISYVSQFCNRAGEAFNSGSEKILSSLELKEHINDLKTNSDYKYYMDGTVITTKLGVAFKTNAQLNEIDKKLVHPFIDKVPFDSNDDIKGCVRIYRIPYRDIEGNVPQRVYFVTYDPYGASIEQGEITDKHSLASIQVWTYPNAYNITDRIIVAEYRGRLNTTEECDELCIKIADYYNAKILAEMDRGTMLATCKKLKKLNILLSDPTDATKSRSRKSKKNTNYGMVLGSTKRKFDGIIFLKDLLYEPISIGEDGMRFRRFHNIHSLVFCRECDKFSNKGNYDTVSTGILAGYELNNFAVHSKIKTTNVDSSVKKLSQLLLKNKN